MANGCLNSEHRHLIDHDADGPFCWPAPPATPDRDPNRLHDQRCLASALICAIENARDAQIYTDLDFRIAAQNNAFLEDADEYLRTGIATCVCAP